MNNSFKYTLLAIKQILLQKVRFFRSENRGNTFVELTIVLIGIALLIGAILFGQSLIESSKVISVVTDMEQYFNGPYAMYVEKTGGHKPGDDSTQTVNPGDGNG